MTTLWRFVVTTVLQAFGWVAAVVIAVGLGVVAALRLRDAPVRSHWINASHMRISDAARLMYNRSSPFLRQFAINEAGRDSFSTPSKYFEGCIIVAARQKIVTLYGTREAGLMHEPIPDDYMEGVYQSKDGNFESFFDPGEVQWHDVRVSRSDAMKALREFELDEKRLRLA